MHLEPSAEDAAFRQEVRAFLDAHLSAELREAGRLTTSVFTDKDWNLAWHRILYAKGWVAPAWPKDYGGTGWTERQRHIFAAECALAGAPNLSPMGLKMVGPCIMGFGTPEQKAFYLPRILAGEDYWCQGYSEPGSGSDLASLQLRAVRDGDHYVLNGSKIWTTHAHFANRMFALCRTNFDGKAQNGITFVLLEMSTPGISVKPIITLAGDHEVNQVFFDDVRVPVSGRLGEENQGWTVAKYLLEFERGSSYAAALHRALNEVRALAAAEPGDDGRPLLADESFRAAFVEAEIKVAAIEMSEARVLSALGAGASPGPAASMLKVQGTETVQAIDELAVCVLGRYAAVHQPELRLVNANREPVGPRDGVTTMARYLNNRAASIYGGSNEIQRNIMAGLMIGRA